MTTEYPAAYLAALPSAIQEPLADLARTTITMCDEDKVQSLTAMTGCAEALFEHALMTGRSNFPLAFMDAAGRVIKAAYHQWADEEVD